MQNLGDLHPLAGQPPSQEAALCLSQNQHSQDSFRGGARPTLMKTNNFSQFHRGVQVTSQRSALDTLCADDSCSDASSESGTEAIDD